MARPASGSVRFDVTAKVWVVRVTLADGRRSKPLPMKGLAACEVAPESPPRGCACRACKAAHAKGRQVSDRMRKGGAVEIATEETSTEWFERYTKLHGELGYSVTQHPGEWERYVAPTIGTRPMAAVTSEDIVAIRDALTKLRRTGKISAKRALNVWSSAVKSPFSRAFVDDDPEYSSVRVGPSKANPTIGIKPPVTREDCEEDERERQPLEPSEFLALVSFSERSIEDRRMDAVMVYTGLTTSELHGLLVSDVRLAADPPRIKVQRALNMKSGEDGRGKTRNRERDVPIHPHLLPLMELLVEGKAPSERLFPIFGDPRSVEARVGQLRKHLPLAGITRPEILEGTATLRAFDVRSFRTTFATWCIRSQFDSALLDYWLGHAPKSTAAKHYVKVMPPIPHRGIFPQLPATLTEPEGSGGVSVFRSERINDSESLERLVRESKPVDSAQYKSTEGARGERQNAQEMPSKPAVEVIAANASESPSRSTVLVADSAPETKPSDADEALRTAIKAAIDAGNIERARVLIELLAEKPKVAPVVDLATRRVK